MNNYKFTGYERDAESNLDNAQARYYSSPMGRFMSPDPYNAGADPTNPQSWNMYSYVNNNPLALTDPTGLGVCDTLGSEDCLIAAAQCNTYQGLGECETYNSNLQCQIDGVESSCGIALQGLQDDFAAQCPDNACGITSINGVLAQFSCPQTGCGYRPAAGPDSGFSTRDQALIAGALYAEFQSLMGNGNEQCGVVYEGSGGYSFTLALEGTVDTCVPLPVAPPLTQIVGAYHSHGAPRTGYYQERFSGQPGDPPGDVQFSAFYAYPLSVATPGGRAIVYYPAMGCQTFFLGAAFGSGTTLRNCTN